MYVKIPMQLLDKGKVGGIGKLLYLLDNNEQLHNYCNIKNNKKNTPIIQSKRLDFPRL